ncbi:DMP19 family protein [Tannockella kyphosi]|uniref:DMP19 family protein n=1 Tax=Tannockella kyphosi TaxID=2899121 RepID=UPI0020113E08|nr:hypothetical protein [Tannockella kyphosi]
MDSTDFSVLSMFIAMAIFLGIFYFLRIRQIQAERKARARMVLERRKKFANITLDMFDEIERKELPEMVIYSILAKDEKRFDGEEIDDTPIMEMLSEAERMVFTIYQVESCLSGKNSSIHSFFLEEYFAPYIPYLTPAFDVMNCHEISKLLESAKKLAEIIESDSEEEVGGDYESYNFGDYTNELLSLMKSSALVKNTAEYIYENKEQFVEKED